jgi:hypothetical protein
MWSRRSVFAGVVLVAIGGGTGLPQAASLWSGGVGAPIGAQRLAGSGAGAASVASAASASESSSLGEERSAAVILTPQPRTKKNTRGGPVRPFSRIALGTSAGTLGVGAQVATPLASWLNLRGGVDLLNFGYGLGIDGANYAGQLHLKNMRVSADLFPFRTGFHISPGILIFEGGLSASVSVAGGSAFQLGNNTFSSSASDPVNGSASLSFGRKMMPMVTFGFSNMVARGRKHWTVPLELGAAYTGHYAAQLSLQGTACIPLGCMSTSSPVIQQSVVAEQNSLNEPMKHFQLYPIILTGVSFRF